MSMTIERTEAFANYLKADVDRANKLIELAPEDALKVINADGNDFTLEEITEFGENLKAVAMQNQSDELDEASLENVSGGVIATAAAAVYLTCITIGIGLGAAAASNWTW